MKETEQTLLDQIKDQIAREKFPYEEWWSWLDYDQQNECWPIVCEIKAKHNVSYATITRISKYPSNIVIV